MTKLKNMKNYVSKTKKDKERVKKILTLMKAQIQYQINSLKNRSLIKRNKNQMKEIF